MIKVPFDEVNNTHVESLLNDSVVEGRTLEYKQEIKASSDSEKKEFLADIVSFANSGGGDILFGIQEDAGTPQGIIGVPCADWDKEILRLEEIIRNGIEPRLLGIRLKHIPGFSRGSVLLIRIPQSWQGPHMVCFQASSRFYARGSAGKSLMNVHEIRNAFSMSESIPQRMRAFRDERVNLVESGDVSTGLTEKQHLVMHFLPFASFSQHFAVDMDSVYSGKIVLPKYSKIIGWSRPNLDGFVEEYFGADCDGPSYGYAQLFRNGVLEIVDSYVVRVKQHEGRDFILPNAIESQIVKVIDLTPALIDKFGISPPIFLFTSLLGMSGLEIHTGNSINPNRKRVDRDRLLLPEIEINQNTSKIAKSICDVFRQSFGMVSSPNFDGDGNWIPPR